MYLDLYLRVEGFKDMSVTDSIIKVFGYLIKIFVQFSINIHFYFAFMPSYCLFIHNFSDSIDFEGVFLIFTSPLDRLNRF